ncbi:T9SS type A sorting domain-containing protein [Taibaiella lutea]|uniref:T9SS type A sorting domain-containing protein n=1 Tax=Taibaiella lutea TaxID=2608001 RepID=A0A5M6CEY9_9BACT|nr:T9SS type A sorting domain-containing protein [Taibaiella lutea]KAA5533617.1 T9SS type A sorting domain-containing protein [Taibaiella lutea]
MNLRKLLGFALLMAGTWTLQAQQRKCEMNIELISPSEGQVIPAYAQYNLDAKITNNGPNTLNIGDTLFYNIPTIPLVSYNTYILEDSIPMGSSVNVSFGTLNNINQNENDETVNFYVKIVSNPDGTGAFIDEVLTNNTDQNTITYKPCGINGGTAIHNVNGEILDFTLFPNPATDVLQLETKDLKVNNVTITDISGRIVVKKTVAPAGEIKLDIATLPRGMYFLKMDTDKGVASSKFIKQ